MSYVVQRQLLRIRLSEAHPLLESLRENIKLLVGNTRSSGTPALYVYSSCSASTKRRNGIGTSRRELFHNRRGRRLWISTPLEPTPWLDYKSACVDLDPIEPTKRTPRSDSIRLFQKDPAMIF
jgi:hypothetical protein